MKRLCTSFVVAVVCCCAPTFAAAQAFFTNFAKPEYIVPVTEFPQNSGGDLNGTYYEIPIPLVGNGELLILGEFPRARYFSITAYDDHGAIVGNLNDQQIRTLNATPNPYAVGGPAGAEDVLYAVTIRLGDPLPPNPNPQCTTPTDVRQNLLDIRLRHTAGTYYSRSESGFTANTPGYGNVVHTDATSNTGGFIMLRSYLLQPPGANSTVDYRKPLVWLRIASTGCAVQLAPAGQYLTTAQWFSQNSLLKLDQVYAHVQHEIDLGTQAPWGTDPVGDVSWFGREEYQPGQMVGQYLAVMLPTGSTPADLNAQGRVLRLQIRLPVLPCHTSVYCGLTGNEQLRYWSLTFENAAGLSLGSMTELNLTPDANGYATVVISFGTTVPAYVTTANGYTVFVPANNTVARLVLRNWLPSSTFGCSTWNVPYRTAEYQPNGGYMGEYVPVVTFPAATSLPATATPFVQSNMCTFP